jgi:HEAT repeat protein
MSSKQERGDRVCIASFCFFLLMRLEIAQPQRPEATPVPNLIEALRGNDLQRRKRAADALASELINGDVSSPQSVAALLAMVELLADCNLQIRGPIISSLDNIASWRGIRPQEGKRITPALLRVIENLDSNSRLRLWPFLVAADPTRKQDAIALCVQVVQDKTRDDRFTAAIQLADLDPTRGEEISFLAECLNKHEPGYAAAAAYHLGRLGPVAKAAVPALKEVINRLDPDERVAAAHALAKISPADGEKTIPVLQEILQVPIWRQDAALALACIGPPAQAALPKLHELLKQLDAARVAGKESADGKNEKLRARRELERVTVLYALARVDRSSCQWVPQLQEALQDPDWFVRSQVLYALTELGPEARQATPWILKTIREERHRHKVLVIRCCRALRQIDAPSREIAPLLQELLTDPNYRVCEEAAKALAKH